MLEAREPLLWVNPPLPTGVRSRIAEMVLRWALPPSLMAAAFAALVVFATAGVSEPTRLIPLLVFAPPCLVVYRLQRARRWLFAAAVFSAAVAATLASAILLNSVFAPAACLGFLLLMLVVPLFGVGWGAASAGLLLLAGGGWLILDAHGLSTGTTYAAASTTYGLYAGFLLLALALVSGPQWLLSAALADARRKHEEAEVARRAEQASERAFRAVFDRASVSLVLLGTDGRVVRLNPRAAELLESSEGALIGDVLAAAPRWDAAQRRLLGQAVAAAAFGQTTRHELTLARAGHKASSIHQLTISPFAASGVVEHLLVEIVDVTDLVETRAQLAQARRLEDLGKLSGGVAHDLNNMLGAILGGCELARLARKHNDGRKIDDNIALIQASVLRAASLTKQLLAFGRKERWNSEQLDLNRLAAETAALLERTLHKNVELVVIESTAPLFVRADAAALEHALLNLALNAQDAMPNGGTLTICCRSTVLDATACAKLSAPVAAGPCAIIAVEDTGTGMSAEIRERMFEPFFTTKAPGHGTGLGLAAVQGTARSHGGALAVSTQEGIGTRIELLLPAAAVSTRPPEPVAPPAAPVRLRARVLLADDEAFTRRATAAMLEAAGCELQVVCDGTALIDALAEGATPDVIVSDLAMPGMSGVGLVRTLEAMRPDCPLVLITGQTGDDIADACQPRSGRRLLRKPFLQAELLQSIGDVLLGPRTRRASAVDG
jgi:two-component system, cell cycle sensor histidine kinase and response regulator CckA